MTEREARIRRIRRTSSVMKRLSFGAVVGLSVLYAVAFMVPEGARAVIEAVAGPLPTETLSPANIAVVAVIGAVPFGFFLAAVATAGRLFRAFQLGAFFDPLSGKLLGRIGAFILLSELAGIIARSAAGAYLSIAAGTNTLAITVSSQNVAGLLFAGLTIVIGWVIAEAAELAEDNRQIV